MKPWPTRLVRRNHACQRPSLWCFVDCESEPKPDPKAPTITRNVFRLAVACCVENRKGRVPLEQWVTCWYQDDFWDQLKRWADPRRVLWVVAHNASFDLTLLRLWERLETGELKVERPGKFYRDPITRERRESGRWHGTVAIDGTPFILETEWNGCRVNWIDSQNYFPGSLAELGKSVGIRKQPMPAWKDSDVRWIDYCANDVRIVKTAVLGLVNVWEKSDFGNWKPSAAALSWSHYRHCHMPAALVRHQADPITKMEWESYRGGECRAWFRGTVPEPVVCYDVNSLYPSVMAARQFPAELMTVTDHPDSVLVAEMLKRFLVIADCEIQTMTSDIPVIRNNKSIYPTGRFRATIATPDFEHLWRRNEIATIHRAAWYRPADLFGSFVAEWYTRKLQALEHDDWSSYRLAKLILNSLAGKFGQRRQGWEATSEPDVVRPWSVFPWTNPKTGVTESIRALGWNAQRIGERVPSEHAMPSIAAHITAYGRQHMRNLRSLVSWKNVFYQDTDSLVVADRPEITERFDERCHPTRLGMLRRTGRYSYCEIRGRRNYRVDDRQVIAGIRSRDREESDGVFVGERFERSGSIVTRKPDGTVKSWRRETRIGQTCDEGGYDSDGWFFPVDYA